MRLSRNIKIFDVIINKPLREFPHPGLSRAGEEVYTNKKRGFSLSFLWCRRRDSNPQGVNHMNLNHARLPIPPLRHLLSGFYPNLQFYFQLFYLFEKFFRYQLRIFRFFVDRNKNSVCSVLCCRH